MKKRFPVAIRLSTLPMAVGLAVLILSGLTILDLATQRRVEEKERESRGIPSLQLPKLEKKVALTADVPDLTEEQALSIVKDQPSRAAVARLWPIAAHRDVLFKVLLDPRAPEEVRLYLLARFEMDNMPNAVAAARAMAGEKELGEGPILLSAFEILSRSGEPKDLALFTERPGESNQLKTLREEYRDALRTRSQPGTN